MKRSDWPEWPERDSDTYSTVSLALLDGRWAVASAEGREHSPTNRAQHLLARRFSRSNAILTTNGSAALVAALQALDIGPGSRVALPALTWIGCITAVLRVGATPVLIDLEDGRPVMDIDALSGAGKLDAIMAIHHYASAVDISDIRAKCPYVPIIEDASHVHGGIDRDGRTLGTLGDIAVFSLQATKVLTCGEGGAALTDDARLASRLEAARTDGRIYCRSANGGPALKPGDSLHGANLAMAEPLAALLCDQLTRLDMQCIRRGRGATTFIKAASRHGLQVIADPALSESGGFYGLPVLVEGHTIGPDRLLEEIWREWGIPLDRLYPRLDRGELYRPETLRRFANNPIEVCEAPSADFWRAGGAVVPHWAFLAPDMQIEQLAEGLAGVAGRSRKRTSSRIALHDEPPVTVVIVSARDPASAMESVRRQTYKGAVQILVVIDAAVAGTNVEVSEAANVTVVRVDLGCRAANAAPVARVARLRNVALQLFDTPLVCFLDDDNDWEPFHLESLYHALADGKAVAAYSWRRLLTPDGGAWSGDEFPWLPPGSLKERLKYMACVESGVISPGDSIIRDAVFPANPDAAMVDLGAWLFRRDGIKLIGFDTFYDEDALKAGTGEDDRLLAKLQASGALLVCSETPSLIYRLGGFSNSFEAFERVDLP